ncbi:hypothetical protein [uncultured Clostridium sp.]|uniref:hypothetical protein n=1 Tax=uncultured Clostridium sp. TaxID=59620 RepID=UPI002672B8F8|nr:hypothetical protein [uncultured Clostridium sp.]
MTNIPTEISKNLPSKNTIENSIDTSMLTDLKTSVEDLNTKYSSLESLVKATADNIPVPQTSDTNSELSSKISNLEEKLDAFNDIINTLKLNDDILKNILNKNDETIASIVDHLAEIEVKLSSISDSSDFSPMINSLNNSVNTLKSSINEINLNNSSAIEKVNTRLNTLENPNISKFIEENITPLANSLSALQAQYETLKQQISLISITPLN